MLTRRAASLEDKLRATLKELETSKNLCNQLLQERDDSEVELKIIVDKNTELKKQLADFHTQHEDILNQHQHLRQLVSDFQECRDTHDLALSRISELELELSRALDTIAHMEAFKASERSANTCSLYNELVGSESGPICVEPIITIDLTNDTITRCPLLTSHNKIKKYIKLNRLIRKTQKTLKRQKVHKINIKLRKQNLNLIQELKNYHNELQICRTMYDNDTQHLQNELFAREYTLRDIFNKYEASQQDLSERMQEASELVDLVRSNAERYESLTNNLSCSCACSQAPESQYITPDIPTPMVTQSVGACVNVDNLSVNVDNLNMSNLKNTTYLFSDKFGQSFGSVFSQCSQHYVVNHCLPGASFSHLINNIKLTKLNPSSTVILLYGDSLAVKKKDIIESIRLMLHLNETNKCKFIICAFPYSQSLSNEQNRHIFDLNMFLFNRTCRHNNAILLFDTNQFISNFRLTKYNMYLPASSRRQIANLLAYNIQTDTGTCNVPTVAVSNDTNITIDTPCSLNY